ncbi:WD40-repeat-containing domain protein [Trametes gibbosa]|nr:WD40-repeat-containing domain protein [Trametes gibbosa]
MFSVGYLQGEALAGAGVYEGGSSRCARGPLRQLRDVLICPHEKGIVSYARCKAIIEHDLLNPHATPRRLAELTFTPNTISALILPDTNDTLLAAGGQEADLHLSYYQASSSCSPSFSARPIRSTPRGFGRRLWESKYVLERASINNSVMLTSMSFTRSNESSANPRILVSNNDHTVKFYDIALRNGKATDDFEPRLLDIGQLPLAVPVNHSSVSPDGRTLLCVGDSPDVYLHRITGGSRISFTPIATLSLSAHIEHAHAGGSAPVSSVPASFSTAFSADGSKFAVASQEGVVVVWDVRSTKPLKVFRTDKTRASYPARMATGAGSGWLYDLPWDWSRNGTPAPGWGVRSVKFSPQGAGREVMTFTEHTSLLHVVDARTFETEEIVRMPNFDSPAYVPLAPSRPRSTSPVSRALMRTTPPTDASLPDTRRTVLFNALEDTFRIPTSDSSTTSGWRVSQRVRRFRSRDDLATEDDQDNIVVIPPLGDREVDSTVRRLLARRHSPRTTLVDPDADPREPLDSTGDAGEEMDVDELESDCLSSRAPSRSGSPAPSSQLALQSSGTRPLELLRTRPTLLARRESSGPYAGAGTRWGSAASSSRPRRRHAGEWRGEDCADDELDLAGVCFDPTGTFVYAASVKGVAEWRVRGAEQQWWTAPEWA